MTQPFGHEKLMVYQRLLAMTDTLARTLNRPLNRHPYSDTLNRPASAVSIVGKHRNPPTDFAEDPYM
jgi:hypothetical protein